MKQEILNKFLLSQTSLRDAISISEFRKLPELGKLLAGTDDSEREQVIQTIYQALLAQDYDLRNEIKESISEFTSDSSNPKETHSRQQLSEPSINSIFTETLIQALNSKSAENELESQKALTEITESTEALLNVSASIKLKKTRSKKGDSKKVDYELPEDTIQTATKAADEISDLIGVLQNAVN